MSAPTPGCQIPTGDNFCNCGDGLVEHPGTLYLFPYWLARFEKILK